MPEGDTLHRAAAALRKALLNRTVLRFETTVPAVAAADAHHRVAGRVITRVEARGKNLLITIADWEPAPPRAYNTQYPTPNAQHPTPTLVLRTHLRMTGSWHLYRPGERWQKPAHRAVVVLHTDEFIAPCFSAPVVELLTEQEAERHPDLKALGPDAMTQEFDAPEAAVRLRRYPDVEIGVALMNQRAMAGVGNVYKSEVLFLRRVSPFLKVRELDEQTLSSLIEEAHRLLRLNEGRGARRTTCGLNARERLWVYGRSGEPCRVCGAPIRMRRQGLEARSTYYCPNCQSTDR